MLWKMLGLPEPIKSIELVKFIGKMSEADISKSLIGMSAPLVKRLMDYNEEILLGEKSLHDIEAWNFTHHFSELEFEDIYIHCSKDIDFKLRIIEKETEMTLDELSDHIDDWSIDSRKAEIVVSHLITDAYYAIVKENTK